MFTTLLLAGFAAASHAVPIKAADSELEWPLPGAASLQIGEREWYLERPASGSAQDFLLALYPSPRAVPALHAVPLEQLVPQGQAHTPAGLPEPLYLAVDA